MMDHTDPVHRCSGSLQGADQIQRIVGHIVDNNDIKSRRAAYHIKGLLSRPGARYGCWPFGGFVLFDERRQFHQQIEHFRIVRSTRQRRSLRRRSRSRRPLNLFDKISVGTEQITEPGACEQFSKLPHLGGGLHPRVRGPAFKN